MSAIKEYREFFLRNVQVNTGSKSDQEVGFITSYFVNGITKFNRFLKGHFPSQDVMNKFVTSITFKLNQEDTAKLGEQGLSKIAADADAESRTSNIISDYTATVVPHQLPEVIGTITGNDSVISVDQFHGIEITTLKRTISGKFRRIYKLAIAVGAGSLTFDGDDLTLMNDDDSPGANKYYGTTSDGSKGFFSLATIVNSLAQAVYNAGNKSIILSFGDLISVGVSIGIFKFISSGATFYGKQPTAYKLLYYVTGGTADIILGAEGVGLAIAETTAGGLNSTTQTVLTIPIVNPLPNAQDILDAVISVNSGSPTIHIRSLTIEF